MAQYDVHRNPGRDRDYAPFLLIVQSSRFDAYPTRLVLPLITTAGMTRDASALTPRFHIAGQSVALNPLLAFTIPAARLGAPVASPADHASQAQIINAIDEVLSTAHG